VKNTRVHCPGPWGIFSYEKYYSGGGLIQDTEVGCMNNEGATGIVSYGLKALRVNVHGCESGFSIDYDVTIQDSYIYGFTRGRPVTATVFKAAGTITDHSQHHLQFE
jgi:hypothetical protein